MSSMNTLRINCELLLLLLFNINVNIAVVIGTSKYNCCTSILIVVFLIVECSIYWLLTLCYIEFEIMTSKISCCRNKTFTNNFFLKMAEIV